jgi:hypothetical protein
MLRRSAAAAFGLTCIPGAVVRSAVPAGVRVAADDHKGLHPHTGGYGPGERPRS